MVQHRKVRSELNGELDTNQLTREEILEIYKQHERVGARRSTIQALREAIVNREYEGPPIDLAAVRAWPRTLRELIADNTRRDHAPDPHTEHTVGLEVEFGYHESPLLNFTHIELARSTLGGYVNNLPFKLETDSGGTVEIVTPPCG